jgi:hypothetical protein
MVGDQLSRFKQKGVREARRVLWIFAYLWVLLGLFALHKSIVLNEPDPFYHQGFAVINALVLAKIVYIAEAFNVADNLKSRPLIYPILYRSAMFSLILILFHLIEESSQERGMESRLPKASLLQAPEVQRKFLSSA